MSDKKYKLTDESIEVEGRTLYRITAVTDFGDVKAGDTGGYIEKESNLVQTGCCWVYDNAMVYGDAKVSGLAIIYGEAKIFAKARVSGWAIISGTAKVVGNTHVFGVPWSPVILKY